MAEHGPPRFLYPMLLRHIALSFALAASTALTADATSPAATPVAVAFATGHQRNLFAELLGKSEAEVQAKIDAAWQQLFHGRDADQRLYYPVGGDMAYIADIGNGDVRSEGMSYGLMLAVQLDRRAEFDRLWKWTKAHMYHPDGPRRGYFAWHCRFDGTQLDPGSASDGEEWFAMALLFAANRWGSEGRANPPGEPSPSVNRLNGDASPLIRNAAWQAAPRPIFPPDDEVIQLPLPPRPGAESLRAPATRTAEGCIASPCQQTPGIDYAAEAQALLDAMRRSDRGAGITAIFDPQQKQVVFAPTEEASRFTDPSYHLPAFYELWARWDRTEDGRRFWEECVTTSRVLLQKAAHPKTGLMPEYAQFDGTPFPGERGDFRYDAWRTLANVALDYAWFVADPWQVEQSNRVLGFLTAQGAFIADRYTLDGKPVSTDESIGLFAMAAVAGLAADPELARPFVQRLWDAPIPEGQWRYYNGLLYFLALLEAGGRFQIHAPPAGTALSH